ncbi:serine/threonine-protein kinase Nek5-like [Eupeodes corollae]|uniref:serine/threonine-protein kinase Nek5-like n=1 Tax=Eupeodes corollae TaxID=290404 RepID=UPI002490E87C|nr:serine/threonine-protein kinase Nek5-like [Eupeodes corollae]
MNLENSGFHVLKLLGEGTFGKVFLAETANHRHPVCVKQIVMQNPSTELKMIREEVYIISQLKHPRIIKFLQSFVQGEVVNIIMEYASGGTMRTIIENNLKKPLTQSELLAYFCDMLSGLEYLHIRHVIHRDLKPENILIDKNNRIKIADFGIALIHSSHAKKMDALGTPYYLAPEILRGYTCDFKADIWSLGCILYEMCTGCGPFSFAETMSELRAMVLHSSSAFYHCKKMELYYGKMWSGLCERMLTYDRTQRIPLPEIVKFNPTITLYFYNLYFDYSY